MFVYMVCLIRNFSPLVICDMSNRAQRGASSYCVYFLRGEGSRPSPECAEGGLDCVTFLLEATAAAPSPWGPAQPSPSAQVPALLTAARHLSPPATPHLRLFQQGQTSVPAGCWGQESFHTLTGYWGRQRAFVCVGFVCYTHHVRN